MSGRLLEVLDSRRGELLLFGLTPPRTTTSPEDVARIAEVTLGRLAAMDLDGLVLYDIDDESDRNPEDRPYPFSQTLDPAGFAKDHLAAWGGPIIIYRSVGKYAPEEIDSWLRDQDTDRTLTVFVGASSSGKSVRTSLSEAQTLWRQARPELRLGGVAIPERHSRRTNEHARLLRKQEMGCTFFVTQVVYDVTATKNMVSDYFYTCRDQGIAPAPIVFTLSVCGSLKTLEFLEWLGVDVPTWLQNELRHSDNPLEDSVEASLHNATELMAFCRQLGTPFGFNVESVSNRRVEIEASVELARKLRRMLA